jgi:hypothetical protein
MDSVIAHGWTTTELSAALPSLHPEATPNKWWRWNSSRGTLSAPSIRIPSSVVAAPEAADHLHYHPSAAADPRPTVTPLRQDDAIAPRMRGETMPPRQGPLRRIEQLRHELEAEGKLTAETERTSTEPAWKSSSKPKEER